eukprot:TRINITY_DN3599_c0_g1_i1.p1 TRINITY_DN3599_c0_g1~~TRINITY_DN3599_c0_g1_i1.p1  ORF type:complete len:441 (+),score=96.53 TRINITY_DN3599_c0_g1_i1:546-1868(+)
MLNLSRNVLGVQIKDLIVPSRELLVQGPLWQFVFNKAGTKVTRMTQIYVFLFNDAIMFTKLPSKEGTFVFKGIISLSTLTVHSLDMTHDSKYLFELRREVQLSTGVGGSSASTTPRVVGSPRGVGTSGPTTHTNTGTSPPALPSGTGAGANSPIQEERTNIGDGQGPGPEHVESKSFFAGTDTLPERERWLQAITASSAELSSRLSTLTPLPLPVGSGSDRFDLFPPNRFGTGTWGPRGLSKTRAVGSTLTFRKLKRRSFNSPSTSSVLPPSSSASRSPPSASSATLGPTSGSKHKWLKKQSSYHASSSPPPPPSAPSTNLNSLEGPQSLLLFSRAIAISMSTGVNPSEQNSEDGRRGSSMVGASRANQFGLSPKNEDDGDDRDYRDFDVTDSGTSSHFLHLVPSIAEIENEDDDDDEDEEERANEYDEEYDAEENSFFL